MSALPEGDLGGSGDRDLRRFDQLTTDWSQVRRAIDPDHRERQDGLAWFHRTYAAPMRSLLSHILRRHGRAEIEDLVQEICVSLAEGRFERVSREAGGRFRNYLKTVTRRKAHDYLSRQQRRKEVSGEHGLFEWFVDDHDDGPERAFDRAESVQILRDALQRLEARCRTGERRWYALVVKLRFWPEQCCLAFAAGERPTHQHFARKMTELTGEPWTVDRFKKQLERGLKLCGQCLRTTVESRLWQPTPAEVDDCIRELNLGAFGA